MIQRLGPPTARPAFSLVELLVVIGIIALLAGILFPTISKIRLSAQEADSKSMLNQIDQACLSYYQDFKAYPGPLPYVMLTAQDQTAGTSQPFTIYSAATGGTIINNGQITSPGTATTAAVMTGPRITGSENLLLGLCGGLAVDRTNPAVTRYYFDASAVGQGALNFNPLRPGRTNAYLQPSNISKGLFTNEAGTSVSGDSIIPEFVDKFANPLPFLYLRSRNNGVSSTGAETLVVNDNTIQADYNILEIQPYTSFATPGGSTLSPGDYVGATYSPTAPHGLQTANPARTTAKNPSIPSVTYRYPYDAYDYLVDPSSYDRTKTSALTASETAAKRSRKRDSYVLISAGRDRIYGTADDLTNFGAVLP